MPSQVQFRRGNTAQVQAFTGAVGEIAIDTTTKQISVQDGATPGGTYLATQSFAQAAYNTANSAASGAYATAAFDTANGAFIKANTANTTADAGFAKANLANTLAQSAFNQANTANVTGQSAFDKANVANTIAQSAYNWSNTINVFAQSAYTMANTANITGQAAFDKANLANITADAGFAKVNTVLLYAQSAFSLANTTSTVSQSAYDWSNTINVFAQSAYSKANVANTTAEAGFAKANVANTTAEAGFAKANVANTLAQAAFDRANTKFNSSGGTISGDVTVTGNILPTSANTNTLGSASYPWKSVYVGPNSLYIGDIKLSSVGGALQLDNATNLVLNGTSIPNSSDISLTANAAFAKANVANTTADAAYAWGNTINVFTQSAFSKANVANTTADAGFAKANLANTLAQSAYDSSNTVLVYAQSAFSLANTTSTVAQGAFDRANTKFNSSGGTISGAVTISGNNSLTVTGNLIVQGATFSSNTTTFELNDPLILLGVGNYLSDTKDIGFAGHYNDGTNAHSGLIRDYGTKEYYFFKGYTPEIDANNNVDITHYSFATANVNANKVTAKDMVANTFTMYDNACTSISLTSVGSACTSFLMMSSTVDTWSSMTYRTAKYLCQITAGSSYHAIELLAIHDGNTANLVQYGEIVTANSLGYFDATIISGTFTLTFTPTVNQYSFIKFTRELVKS
jgi:hypothetical protein